MGTNFLLKILIRQSHQKYAGSAGHLVKRLSGKSQDNGLLPISSQALNDHFTNVGSHQSSQIQASISSYLPSAQTQSMYVSTISSSEVEKIIKTLQNKKSAGPDGLTPAVVKLALPVILEPLTIIF